MKRLLSYPVFVFLLGIAGVSCIVNDLPYPQIEPAITAMKVDDAASIDINEKENSVLIHLEERADRQNVNIREVTLKDDITKCSTTLTGVFNLEKPLHFTLTNYDLSRKWTISSVQEIDRYFYVSSQMGETVIDDVNHRVLVNVPDYLDLETEVCVLAAKLGPEGAEYSRDLLGYQDFRDVMEVKITAHGREENWRIFVTPVEVNVSITKLSAWTRVAWVKATGVTGAYNGFKYRVAGTEEWTVVSDDAIEQDGGTFSACIEGLTPETSYECCAFSGDILSKFKTFTTEKEEQLPNSSFEIYSNAESNNYKSWWDPASLFAPEKWWDSGNKGSTSVGSAGVICAPDPSDFADGSSSARLNSKYVVIKFAAGNLFSGEFAGLVGTSGGKVNFGRPFTLRPRKLVLWIKYNCGVIDNVGEVPEGSSVKKGDNDQCQIFIALGDWDYKVYGGSKDSPVQVNTTDKKTLFNPEADAVIAYGSFTSNKPIGKWQKVEIPLEYRDVHRQPTHIVVSCAASMLGDYFTGSSTSTLWVDAMQLIY